MTRASKPWSAARRNNSPSEHRPSPSAAPGAFRTTRETPTRAAGPSLWTRLGSVGRHQQQRGKSPCGVGEVLNLVRTQSPAQGRMRGVLPPRRLAGRSREGRSLTIHFRRPEPADAMSANRRWRRWLRPPSPPFEPRGSTPRQALPRTRTATRGRGAGATGPRVEGRQGLEPGSTDAKTARSAASASPRRPPRPAPRGQASADATSRRTQTRRRRLLRRTPTRRLHEHP